MQLPESRQAGASLDDGEPDALELRVLNAWLSAGLIPLGEQEVFKRLDDAKYKLGQTLKRFDDL